MSAASQRLGPIELAPGVSRGNVLVKLLASFVGVGALSGMAILQSYILTAHLHVPRGAQGTLAGDLAFWSEIVGILLFVPFGMAGSTNKAHGLKIIYELLETNTQLIANTESWTDPWKKEKIQQIAMLLEGAPKAEGMVGLKMNVPKDKLETIVKLLPSITAPTVSTLYQSDWFSVETVIAESEVRKLIPELRGKGAEGIIEYSLNKII